MLKNYMFKVSIASLLSAFSFSAMAAQDWNDFSDPVAVYSNASIAAGNEGVDISGTYGGYLGGVYKHRFNVAVKNDLEYYEANYLLLNSASESGIAIDTTWVRDISFEDVEYKNTNDAALGFFAKLGFMRDRLNFYPKMSVGYLWGDDDMEDTTYVKFDATTRFSFNDIFWIGASPTYTYGMEGLELNEWDATFDAGAQLSSSFGVSVSGNNDKEFLARMTFAF